jgi:hypothetical protein
MIYEDLGLDEADKEIAALKEENLKLREAVYQLISACEHGDFRSGNVHGGVDEGETIVFEIVDTARKLLKENR